MGVGAPLPPPTGYAPALTHRVRNILDCLLLISNHNMITILYSYWNQIKKN